MSSENNSKEKTSVGMIIAIVFVVGVILVCTLTGVGFFSTFILAFIALIISVGIGVAIDKKVNEMIEKKECAAAKVKCTPKVRQCGIMSNKGVHFSCQKEYRTRGIQENSNKKL
ncbi:MAG: hypothetical protein IKN72_08480 [Clostridia bacterium]|nr:hypothetical protein [Clostridia bacterium]